MAIVMPVLVQCIDTGGYHLTKGKYYIVTWENSNMFRIANDNGGIGLFCKYRFRRVCADEAVIPEYVLAILRSL